MENRKENVQTVKDFYFLGDFFPKSLQMVTTAMKLKDTCSLEEKLQHIGGGAITRSFVSPQPILPIRKLAQTSYLHPSEGRQNESHNHRKLTKTITRITPLCNLMKPWAMPCRDIQDGWVMVESSDKMWSTGEGIGKPLQYSWERHEHYEKAKR